MGIILLHCCVSPLVKLTRRLVFNESSQIFWFFCSNDTAKKDTNTCIFLFLLANLCDFFFFFNNEELWGFKILLKTSYFGVLFVWLVGFCSSGARHLQSLCPTSTSSEISHPSWHYLGFCHSHTFYCPLSNLSPCILLCPVSCPGGTMRGPCLHALSHRCSRGMPTRDFCLRWATATAQPLLRTGVHITLPIAAKSVEKDHKAFGCKEITHAPVPESNLPTLPSVAQAALPCFWIKRC